MSAPQQLRLVGSTREPRNVRAARRQRAHQARLAFEHDNTRAALEFLQPHMMDLSGTTRTGFEVLAHIYHRYEDEIRAYVTGEMVEEVASRK